MKNIRVFLSENFQFLEVKISIYLNRRVFVMVLYGGDSDLELDISVFDHLSVATCLNPLIRQMMKVEIQIVHLQTYSLAFEAD